MFWVCTYKGTDTGTADNDELKRLPKRCQLAAHCHVAANHADDDDNPTYDNQHLTVSTLQWFRNAFQETIQRVISLKFRLFVNNKRQTIDLQAALCHLSQ